MTTNTASQGWHVANWGLWGWIETGLKLVGIVAAYAAFFSTSSASPIVIGGNPELGAVILLALLTLGFVGAVFIRIGQREIISLIFSILNVLGHLALLVALLRLLQPTTLALVFGVCFVLGELAKQRFLAISGYTEAGQTPSAMRRFSLGVVAAYVLLVVFILI